MNEKIFGYTWDQIQNAQLKKPFRQYVTHNEHLPTVTQKDMDLFINKGLDYLEKKQFFGIIDRLKNSNII